MSAKSEGKALYASEKGSSKRGRFHTADKALGSKKDESYLEDEYGHDYKHYAESKGDRRPRCHSDSNVSHLIQAQESLESCDDDIADREFEELMHRPNEGT